MGYLNDNILLRWSQHADGLEATPTWAKFEDFLLRQINDPKLLIRRAQQKFTDAKQRPQHTVREFASFLAQQEALLPEQYSERQRKENLRTRVLPEIRSEVLRYPNEPESYEAFIAHLAVVEEEMPERRKTLQQKRKAPDDKKSNKDSDRKPDKGRGPQSSNPQSTSQAKNDEPFNGECNYCHKWGHRAKVCRKRIADEAKAAGKKPDEKPEPAKN